MIRLLCARCSGAYEAPADETGHVTISVDTLTVLQKNDGRAITALCPTCAAIIYAQAERLT